MRLKSYFASTVEAAMALARQELGPDAMLMHSKKAPPEVRHLGEYEVVFATDQELAPGAPAAGLEPLEKDPTLGKLADDIGSLKRQVERIAASIGYAAAANGGFPFTRPDVVQAFASLVRTGVYPEIVQDILTRSQGVPETELSASLRSLIRETIKTSFWTASNDPRIVVLVGPPGSGKTTTLAKMAAAYGVAARVSTHVISTDVFRIAAADQLRTLCSILGVGCETVETPVALEHSLAEQRNKKLILIDTPGLSERDAADFDCFARFVSARRDIEKHLILPASVKSEDLSRVSDRYRRFGPTHLLFTKLDETSSYGCLLNEAYRTGCPVSFLSQGQNIPEDLDPADSEKIADLILGAEMSGTARVSAAA